MDSPETYTPSGHVNRHPSDLASGAKTPLSAGASNTLHLGRSGRIRLFYLVRGEGIRIVMEHL